MEKVAAEKAAFDAETKTQITREALVQAERRVAIATFAVASKDAQLFSILGLGERVAAVDAAG